LEFKNSAVYIAVFCVLLDTTNLVLLGEKLDLALKFRGRHDLDFTWIPPDLRIIIRKTPTGISQLPSPSSSKAEATEEEKINQYQANLLQVENILNSLSFEPIKANKEAVSLGLELLSVNGFTGFLMNHTKNRMQSICLQY